MRDTEYSKNSYQKLYEIAENQLGLFTAKQAEACGFNNRNHAYHVKVGNWIRKIRGVYRLANFPYSPDEQLMLWHLWSRNRDDAPQGIISHDTALSRYELSDLMPPKIHITVPKDFRKGAQIPEVLILHYEDVDNEDIKTVNGVPMTKPLKTIIDLIEEERVSLDLLEQAVKEGLSRGLFTRQDIKRKKLSAKAKNVFAEILFEIAA